jgi:hypothetical protein
MTNDTAYLFIDQTEQQEGVSEDSRRVHVRVRHAHRSCLSKDERHGWMEEGVQL